MKILIEKLPLPEDISFVARTHRTPNFEVPWHQHAEFELILFTEGAGLSFVGNHVGEFNVDDIYFLGSNVPHTFQKSGNLVTSAIVVHFKENFWGSGLLDLPESKKIRQLLIQSAQSLKVHGSGRERLKPLIVTLEKTRGFKRIILLLECLNILSEKREFDLLSTQVVKELNSKSKERLEKIFTFTMNNFNRPITLEEVAAVANLSVPAFCNYFKKCTKKKYIDFLNEIRIGYASKKLVDTHDSIISICYESGFNTVANFNRQFQKLRQMTPSHLRKTFFDASDFQQVSLDIREIREIESITYFQ